MAVGAFPGRKPGMRTRLARRRSDASIAASTSAGVASTWRETCDAALRSSVTVIPEAVLDAVLPEAVFPDSVVPESVVWSVSVIWVLILYGVTPCADRDSNSDGSPHGILSPARLPIPPSAPGRSNRPAPSLVLGQWGRTTDGAAGVGVHSSPGGG